MNKEFMEDLFKKIDSQQKQVNEQKVAEISARIFDLFIENKTTQMEEVIICQMINDYRFGMLLTRFLDGDKK